VRDLCDYRVTKTNMLVAGEKSCRTPNGRMLDPDAILVTVLSQFLSEKRMINREFALRSKFMHHLLLILVLSALRATAAELREVLPPTPAPVHSERSGQANANGISIYHAVYGQGSPMILLHGGLANTDYWGNQIKALAPHHTVIVMDEAYYFFAPPAYEPS
jgi:hypothetical protein